jgi:hypothetical protein
MDGTTRIVYIPGDTARRSPASLGKLILLAPARYPRVPSGSKGESHVAQANDPEEAENAAERLYAKM